MYYAYPSVTFPCSLFSLPPLSLSFSLPPSLSLSFSLTPQSVTDMSPYVRKTAAHAIPKLYSLDPEHKDQLVEVIEKLLKDQTTVRKYYTSI